MKIIVIPPDMAERALSTWLAATKLRPPARRHDAVSRPRLVDGLRQSIGQSRLTLISAPAGSGKTALLADLLQAIPERNWAWIALDADDNDPSRFLATVRASIGSAEPDSGRAAFIDLRSQVTELVNRIAESDARTGLVLDDLHVITERSVHDALDLLIERLPPNLHLVLASRYDPPLALARWRARGDMGELRLGDLSFTEAETLALVEKLGIALTTGEVAALHARTEGWAAGLRLLATSLAQLPANRISILQSGMQGSRRIFEFLAEEVLDRQEPALRNFLLETSILSSLRPAVCDALTGRRDSARLLEDLYRRNLYIVAADDAGMAFRYHDLFADFLRECLRRDRPEDWQSLHQRAARAETSPDARLRHHLAAEDWDAAAAEIESIGPDYAARGFLATLRRWIEAVPRETRLAHPRVLYLLAHAVWSQRDHAAAKPYIEEALAGFRRNRDVVGQGEALSALAASAIMRQQFTEAREILQEALGFEIPESSRLMIHTAGAWEAICRRDWATARPHVDQVFERLVSGGGFSNPLALILALFCTGHAHYVGRLEEICAHFRAGASHFTPLEQACLLMLESAAELNRGALAASSAHASLAVKIATESAEVMIVASCLCTNQMLVGNVKGDWAGVEAWVTKALDPNYGQVARSWVLHKLYFRAYAQWNSGKLAELRETYDRAMEPNPVEAPPAIVYGHLIQGMMRMAERAYGQAEHAFRQAVREEECYRITTAVANARAFLSYCLLMRGQLDDALKVFSPWLAETDEGNMPGALLRNNPIVIPLLRLAHERNVRRAYCERVLEMLGVPFSAAEAAGNEALSERELEVLRVMAEGLTNKEIAERLFVSEATVKTHVQRILRKLDAGSRTQAIAQARKLMML